MPLAGKHVLITSGPTRANIDAVRYISNRSSGALGSLIAEEALRASAHVTFVYGYGSRTPRGFEGSDRYCPVQIETVSDALAAVERIFAAERVDAVIHLMAVLDYAPAQALTDKTPSGRDEWTVRFVKTPKVIKTIRRLAADAYLVSFKLEVDKSEAELVRIAHESLQRNGSQLVVVNDLTQIDSERHAALFVGPAGQIAARCETKEQIAERLVAKVAASLASPA